MALDCRIGRDTLADTGGLVGFVFTTLAGNDMLCGLGGRWDRWFIQQIRLCCGRGKMEWNLREDKRIFQVGASLIPTSKPATCFPLILLT